MSSVKMNRLFMLILAMLLLSLGVPKHIIIAGVMMVLILEYSYILEHERVNAHYLRHV
jgi:hypothetical protein